MGYPLEKDKTGRARCTVCCDKIAVGDLRVAYGRGKHAHLACWKIKEAKVPKNYFSWNAADMNSEDIQKINEYLELAKQGGSKKRKGTDNIDDTVVKQMKTEILANDEVWDLSESKLSAPVTLMSVEIMSMIFHMLDYKSLAKSSRVCKQWLVLATEDDLWQKICIQYNMKAKKAENVTWRAHFRACLDICFNCKKMHKEGAAEYRFFAPLNAYLCFKCIRLKKFAVISKYACKSDYGFKEADLLDAGLKFVIRDGCRHFLKSQVIALHETKIIEADLAESDKEVDG